MATLITPATCWSMRWHWLEVPAERVGVGGGDSLPGARVQRRAAAGCGAAQRRVCTALWRAGRHVARMTSPPEKSMIQRVRHGSTLDLLSTVMVARRGLPSHARQRRAHKPCSGFGTWLPLHYAVVGQAHGVRGGAVSTRSQYAVAGACRPDALGRRHAIIRSSSLHGSLVSAAGTVGRGATIWPVRLQERRSEPLFPRSRGAAGYIALASAAASSPTSRRLALPH